MATKIYPLCAGIAVDGPEADILRIVFGADIVISGVYAHNPFSEGKALPRADTPERMIEVLEHNDEEGAVFIVDVCGDADMMVNFFFAVEAHSIATKIGYFLYGKDEKPRQFHLCENHRSSLIWPAE